MMFFLDCTDNANFVGLERDIRRWILFQNNWNLVIHDISFD
jgi:hypothetical protein